MPRTPQTFFPLLLLLLQLLLLHLSVCGNSHGGGPAAEGLPGLSLLGASTTLEGRGFHRVLETRVRLQQRGPPAAAAAAAAAASDEQHEEGCLLWLEYFLPQHLFVDPDKTFGLGVAEPAVGPAKGAPRLGGGGPLVLPTSETLRACHGCSPGESQEGPALAICCSSNSSSSSSRVLVDVELPSYSPFLGPPLAVRQEVSIHPSMLQASEKTNQPGPPGGPLGTPEVLVRLPIHLRYRAPCSGSCNGLLQATVATPEVGLMCPGAPQLQLHAAATAAGAAEGLLAFSVPVGMLRHWGLVGALSGLAAAGGLLAIAVSLAS